MVGIIGISVSTSQGMCIVMSIIGRHSLVKLQRIDDGGTVETILGTRNGGPIKIMTSKILIPEDLAEVGEDRVVVVVKEKVLCSIHRGVKAGSLKVMVLGHVNFEGREELRIVPVLFMTSIEWWLPQNRRFSAAH